MTITTAEKIGRGMSIKLTEGQYRGLRREACKAGVTMSQYVRLLLEQDARERQQLASFVQDVQRGAR
jgi:siderophore synthetase component